MKKKNLMVLLLVVLLQITLNAGEKSKFQAFLNTGISQPITPNDFPESHHTAFAIEGGMEYALNKRLKMQLSLDYASFNHKNPYIQVGDTKIKIDYLFSFYTFFSSLKFSLNKNKLSPYWIGGLGISLVRASIEYGIELGGKPYTIYDTTVHLAAAGGFGLDYRISRHIDLFFETKYIYTTFKEEDVNGAGFIPVKIGISVDI
jgi:opacity protein-like surface antigen